MIYLVLRPWQNFVGIEAGLILAGFSLMAYSSGWPGAEWAIVATPLFVAMAVLGIGRLFWRHRIRIESRGLFREQGTPRSRLVERYPATDVAVVYLRSLWQRHWRGLRPLWGVSVTFHGGEEWLLTAGNRAWAERRLARSIAMILQVPLYDQSVEGSEPVPALAISRVLAPPAGPDGPPPEDPCLQVLDRVPRQMVVNERSRAQSRIWLGAAGAVLAIAVVAAFAGRLAVAGISAGTAVVLALVALDRYMAKRVLICTLESLWVIRRGVFPRPIRRIPWRSMTVLGRDTLTGGMVVAHDRGQVVIGRDLSTVAVEWLIGRLQAYLPGHG